MVRCPNCNAGCKHCTHGTIYITSCVKQVCNEADVSSMYEWVRRFEEHHVLPEGGGMLDQTKCFLDCLDLLSHRIANAKARAGYR